jgi:hypothetical protein
MTTCAPCWGLALVVSGVVGVPSVRAQATGPLSRMAMPTIDRSVEVRSALPPWVAMPPTARILTSDGLVMRPLRNSAVTHENTKLGVLVGALGNAGGCARNLRVSLQYTDDHWRPMGEPIDNEARVSEVSPGAPLPYRFRLKRNEDFPEPPSGYILQVVEDGKAVSDRLAWVSTRRKVDTSPCPPAALAVDAAVSGSRATLRGYRVTGVLTLKAGGPLRPDGITLTALLRDANGDVLEVLTGIPTFRDKDLPTGFIENGQALSFTLATSVPLGSAVTTTTIFTEVLTDARIAPARP